MPSSSLTDDGLVWQVALVALLMLAIMLLRNRRLSVTRAALAEREQQLRLITEHIEDFFWLSDTDISRILYASPAYERIWQRPMTELYARAEAFLEAVHPDDCPALLEALAGHRRGEPYEHEYRIRRPDGSLRWIWDRGFPIRDADGVVRRYAGLARDITERRALEDALRSLNSELERKVDARTAEMQAANAALRESEERFRRLFEDARQAMVLFKGRRVTGANRAALELLRLSRMEQLLGRVPEDFSPPLQPDGRASADKASEMLRLACEQGRYDLEWAFLRADGEPGVLQVMLTPMRQNGRTEVHAVLVDLTERKQAQERVDYLAYHDALTGLPNRVLGRDRLERDIHAARRHHAGLAVLFLDLDQFKYFNDSYDHQLGDTLLRRVAERLAAHLRGADAPCRLGGDEFMLVLADLETERAVAEVTDTCERILASLSETFIVGETQLFVSCCIGIALCPDDGDDAETLMSNADAALAEAKKAGQGSYRFYEPQMNRELRRFVETRDTLRLALPREELVLHYQPQIELGAGRVVGVEALLRWNRPGHGLVMPGDFIPVAEGSGLIVPMGRWVLNEACRQAAAWHAGGRPGLVVAVNLSAVQFGQGSLEQDVDAALASSGLDPACLELELTESMLLRDEPGILDLVRRWRTRGIQVSIDDFGTGYSSLAYLKRLQVNKLKIDRSFIVDMAGNQEDRAIVQAIIEMARTLRLKTIAEGVEDATLASQLRFMGCDEVQGYLYSRPLPASELATWLRQFDDRSRSR
ncbi:EAL domain-containing protein [Thiohalocapsa marina]|uniref:cyclic-guanylate-specific phosphodiesterase n=1 Tax=Thiohalocapsa marina TaxID=424902 RepID=A0A5M8FRB5_9GAMM|nr:EAL domain-containing protein [Thiohalocapsa marina]KAA6186666.1 EAL domain-containing protein [Thiohalocapsa marina]